MYCSWRGFFWISPFFHVKEGCRKGIFPWMYDQIFRSFKDAITKGWMASIQISCFFKMNFVSLALGAIKGLVILFHNIDSSWLDLFWLKRTMKEVTVPAWTIPDGKINDFFQVFTGWTCWFSCISALYNLTVKRGSAGFLQRGCLFFALED